MPDLFGETAKGAFFSPCRQWRYALWRIWDYSLPLAFVLMLNPSTADEDKNDPTIERVERRFRRAGFGGIVILNAFAFRATDPKDMRSFHEPIGPENDAVIRRCMQLAMATTGVMMVGWGVHGSFMGRGGQIHDMATEEGLQLRCLGVTNDGAPRHPLYVGYSVGLQPWPQA